MEKETQVTFTQCLNGAVDEFVDAVEKLKMRFPNLNDEQAMTYVMQLKSMCTPREVR